MSAKHATLWPHIEKESYDTTIDDLAEQDSPVAPDSYQEINYLWDELEYNTRLYFWARRVHFGLASWLDFKFGFPDETPHCQRLEVFASEKYLEPLLERGVFDPFPWETRFPFQEHDFSGIGDQMSWLKSEVEEYEDGLIGQAELEAFDPSDYTEQADFRRWTDR